MAKLASYDPFQSFARKNRRWCPICWNNKWSTTVPWGRQRRTSYLRGYMGDMGQESGEKRLKFNKYQINKTVRDKNLFYALSSGTSRANWRNYRGRVVIFDRRKPSAAQKRFILLGRIEKWKSCLAYSGGLDVCHGGCKIKLWCCGDDYRRRTKQDFDVKERALKTGRVHVLTCKKNLSACIPAIRANAIMKINISGDALSLIAKHRLKSRKSHRGRAWFTGKGNVRSEWRRSFADPALSTLRRYGCGI